jgi:hypothetical protein
MGCKPGTARFGARVIAPSPHDARRLRVGIELGGLMRSGDGDWKLLESQDFSHVELYNPKADPEERRDLAAKEAERLGAIRETLQKINAEIEREGPDWWKRLNPNGGGPIKKQ